MEEIEEEKIEISFGEKKSKLKSTMKLQILLESDFKQLIKSRASY